MNADGLIDYCAAARPTHSRLLVASGIASCLVALLLASLGPFFDITASTSKPPVALSVHIRKSEAQRAPDTIVPEQAVVNKPAKPPPVAVPPVTPDLTIDAPPVTDWRAIADAAAKASVDDYAQKEAARASMWRRSHSVMFQPGDEFMLQDEVPLLADVRFVYRSRIVGLGLNIGSCFFGVPIAGVPVEQRSGAITIIVCGRDS